MRSETTGGRGTGVRVVVGVVVAAAAIVVVAALAGGSSGDGGAPSLPLGSTVGTGVWDVVTFALLTVGFSLTIVMFVVQFGGGAEARDRDVSRRRLRTSLIVLVACVLAMPVVQYVAGWFDIESSEVDHAAEAEARPPGGGIDADPDEREPTPALGAVGGIALGAVVVAGGVLWLWSDRRRERRTPEALELTAEEELRDRLRGLLDDAIDALRADPDHRRAVISAWARVEVALASSGLERIPSETAFAYLERVLVDLRASGPAARRLAGLFERAMFSPHVVDQAAQAEAVDALLAVRDELGVGAAR